MNNLELIPAWQTEIPIEQIPRIGHESRGIFRLQLTPDDRYALTLNFQYRELIIWDFASGQRLFNRSWRGYDKVRDLYLTPDGNDAVVVGETGGVVSIIPGQPVPSSPLPREDHVIVNAQSKRAICCNGRSVRVWDFEKNQYVITLETPNIKRDDDTWDPLGIHSISADGKMGAGMFDSHALIWDLETGQLLWKHDFGGPKHWQMRMIFTLGGQEIVLNKGPRIETWRWRTDRIDGPAFDTGSGGIESLVLTSNEQTLITGTDDGAIQLWDWPDGRLRQTLGGHRYEVDCLAVSADGQFLASAGEDTTLRKWHLPSGKQVFSTLSARNRFPLSIDPAGHYVTGPYGHDHATLAIYDLASGALQRVLNGHYGDINAIDFMTDKHLVTASNDHTLRIWDLESGECLQTLRGGHTGRVKAVVALSDRNQVISAATDGRIISWDLTTGHPAQPLLNYIPPTSWTKQYMLLDQRGRRAIINKAGTNRDHVISVLLDLESGQELLEWGGTVGFSHAGGILSPGGRWLIQLQGMWDRLKIIDLQTMQSKLYDIGARVGDMWCFTPDEQTLVSIYKLVSVALIDLKTGEYRLTFTKPEASSNTRITALALSPDGRLGAIAADGHIYIWELSSGQELAAFDVGKHYFMLVFDPHNRYLLAGGSDMLLYCFELRELTD